MSESQIESGDATTQGQAPTFGKLQVHLTCMPVDRMEYFRTNAIPSEGDSEIIFSEPVDAFKCSPSIPLFCVIYDQQKTIRHLASGYRGYPGGTGLTQIDFLATEPFKTSLLLSDLLAAVEHGYQNRAKEIFDTGGLLPPGTSHGVLRALLSNYPDAQNLVRAAVRSRRNILAKLSRDEQFAFQ